MHSAACHGLNLLLFGLAVAVACASLEMHRLKWHGELVGRIERRIGGTSVEELELAVAIGTWGIVAVCVAFTAKARLRHWTIPVGSYGMAEL
jgi:hypothetical protein